MTADWESVKEEGPSIAVRVKNAESRASTADVNATRAYSRAVDAHSYAHGALVRCREAEDRAEVLEAEVHGLRARVKLLEDLVDIADRTAMWGCLLAAVSAGLAVGALIVAIIAEALRWSRSSATGAGTRPP